ncbi:hypothetical protein EXN66_Car013257 [Channa argus]|uniref:Uncharacterized protein n=1 Tax=Channa argus TaxID=215402 RepID=A0A6G1Q4Z8_CHAAH|nr:hypothetical protein EXN66_Car013257 [Channa argus]
MSPINQKSAVYLPNLLLSFQLTWNLNGGHTKKVPGTKDYLQHLPDEKPKKAIKSHGARTT